MKSKNPLPKTQQEKLRNIIIEIQDNKSLLYYLSKNFVFSARRCSGNFNITDFCYFTNELSTQQDREFHENLKKVKLDHLDYKEFIDKYVKYKDRDSLIILDPPYLNSFQKQYNNITFFGLCETIRLLNTMKKLKNDFIFFNMVEKDSIELLNLFDFNFKHQTKKVSVSGNNYREDFMAYVTFDKSKVLTPFNYSLN